MGQNIKKTDLIKELHTIECDWLLKIKEEKTDDMYRFVGYFKYGAGEPVFGCYERHIKDGKVSKWISKPLTRADVKALVRYLQNPKHTAEIEKALKYDPVAEKKLQEIEKSQRAADKADKKAKAVAKGTERKSTKTSAKSILNKINPSVAVKAEETVDAEMETVKL